MISIAGFAIADVLASDRDTTLLRAQRGDRELLLRTTLSDRPTPGERARLRYGHELMAGLDLPGVLRSERLDQEGARLVLTMEPFAGRSLRSMLDRGEIALGDALEIASQLTRTLGALHDRRIIHKNVQPANILVDPRSRQVRLFNFDIATRLGRETPPITGPDRLEGAPAYVSPEQTGRMNRAVDHRTDLYSLGVTLYEMLLGQLPFRATDPMALVHAHIAAPPEAPHEIRLAMPKAVSDVVMKLLAKNAEDRYQSAAGLAADLRECLGQMNLGDTLAEFSPGRHDVSEAFRIPEKQYGREAEKAAVLEAFDRVRRGGAELLLVAGPSGAGKTALVSELNKPAVARRGYFCAGRFERRERVPHGGLVQALRSLFLQVLAEGETRAAAWREAVLDAVGDGGQVVIDLVPEAALLLGPQPALPSLDPAEAQRRFDRVLQQLVGVFAAKDHPLALFLDHLEWADADSLRLLGVLLDAPGERSLLLAGAYRPDALRPDHPLAVMLGALREGAVVTEVVLPPLSAADLQQLVTDTLGHPDSRACHALAQVLASRSGGNPAAAKRLLGAMHDAGLFTFDADFGRWEWSLDRVRDEGPRDGGPSAAETALHKLPERTRRALLMAACSGETFDLKELSAVRERSAQETAAELWAAVEAGLVFPLGDGYKYFDTTITAESYGEALAVRYEFVHEELREAAYAGLQEEARAPLHHRIGRMLLERLPEDRRRARLYEIAGHLGAAAGLIERRADRVDLGRLLLDAGRRARAVTAYGAALRYLRAATDLLGEEGWEIDRELTFDLHRERAACEHLAGREGEAAARFGRLDASARSRAEKAGLWSLVASLHTARGHAADAEQAFAEALAVHGIELPSPEAIEPARAAAIAAVESAIAGRSAADLAAFPDATDADARAMIALLGRAAHHDADPGRAEVAALLALGRALAHGHAPGSACGLLAWALRAGDAGRHAEALALGEAALAVGERCDDAGARAACRLRFAAQISPWLRPLRASLPHLERAYAEALSAGEPRLAARAGGEILLQELLGGGDLRALRDRAEREVRLFQKLVPGPEVRRLADLGRTAALLVHGGDAPTAEERIADGDRFGAASRYSQALLAAFLSGDLARAGEAVARLDGLRDLIAGHVVSVRIHFYEALLAAALHRRASTSSARASLFARLEAAGDAIRRAAEIGPDAFRHLDLLIAAEMASVAGEDARAAELYDRSIDAAAERELTHHQAIAGEAAAGFYLGKGRPRIARAYLLDASAAYARWGADAKVSALAELGAGTLPLGRAADGARSSAAPPDAASLFEALHTIAGELSLDELLRRLMGLLLEHSGARRGVLLLRGERPVSAEAVLAPGLGARVTLGSGALEGLSELTRSVLRAVERTGDRVLHGDASTTDDHAARAGVRSVLGLPLMHDGRALGALYLENDAARDTFTPERCKTVDLLLSQAVVSIANARDHGALEERARELTRELGEAREELGQALRRLRETQKQLVAQEKLASLGAVTAGIAHEIKNPLNFVNNFAELSVELADEIARTLGDQRSRLDLDALDTLDECLADLRQNVVKINSHGRTANSIINGMLLHARNTAEAREDADVNGVVAESVNLAYHGVRDKGPEFDLKLRTDYDPAAGRADMAVNDLRRVLINLVQNACYAARQKKKQKGSAYAPLITVRTKDRGDRVEIHVRDNGTGIPPEVVGSIYNPFFTTKPPGDGTGLGLSISYDIVVNRHQGDLRVETAAGEHTEFIITLPRRPPGAAA